MLNQLKFSFRTISITFALFLVLFEFDLLQLDGFC